MVHDAGLNAARGLFPLVRRKKKTAAKTLFALSQTSSFKKEMFEIKSRNQSGNFAYSFCIKKKKKKRELDQLFVKGGKMEEVV